MQVRSIWGVAVGAMLGLAACGGSSSGSVCDDAVSAVSKFNNQAAACQDQVFAPLDKSDCENVVSGCSDSDKDALDKYFNCLGDVATCDPDNESAFADQIDACANNLQSLSSACLNNFGG